VQKDGFFTSSTNGTSWGIIYTAETNLDLATTVFTLTIANPSTATMAGTEFECVPSAAVLHRRQPRKNGSI
jgi:hypothetical protein